MKAVINGQKTPTKSKYPCLMESDEGDIFYFVREGYGLPLTDVENQDWAYEVEEFANFLNNHRTFTPFTGSITLSND